MIINRLHLCLLLAAVTMSAGCADSSTGPAAHSFRGSSAGMAQLTCDVQITPRTVTTTTAAPGVSAGSSGSIVCRGNAGAIAATAGAAGAAGGKPTVSAADSIL
jgi:hypothetical protein